LILLQQAIDRGDFIMKRDEYNKLTNINEKIEKLKILYMYKISMLQQNIFVEANGIIKDIKRIKRLINQIIKDKKEFSQKFLSLTEQIKRCR